MSSGIKIIVTAIVMIYFLD